MNKEVKYVPLFSGQLEHLNKDYEKLKTQIHRIDHEIESAPKDQGPTPKNRPPGPEGYDTSLREMREKYLQATRDKRVESHRSKIAKSINGVDAKEQQAILSRYDFETSKNGFKIYSKQDLKDVKGVNKEDKVAFDFMAATYFNKYQQPTVEEPGKTENIDTWSDRYMSLLEDFRGRTTDMHLDREGPEPDKD